MHSSMHLFTFQFLGRDYQPQLWAKNLKAAIRKASFRTKSHEEYAKVLLTVTDDKGTVHNINCRNYVPALKERGIL